MEGYTLSPAIRLVWLEDGNHDFKPRKKSGFSQEAHFETAAQAVANLIA